MRRQRILLVEDDPDTRENARRALENGGYEVATAGTSAEGKEIANRGGTLDLCVFDVYLDPATQPGQQTGLTLAKEVSGVLRIIWTDEWQNGPMVVSALEAGIDSVVFKRDGISRLVAEVRSLLHKRVFLVHGHDPIRDTVFYFLRNHGLKPLILADQPGAARSIIELLERYADVGHAVALLTPDDEGRRRGGKEVLRARARQNVVFELGYFSAALGRDRVIVLCDETVERPSNYDGIRYIALDAGRQWQSQLIQAFALAGGPV